MLPPTHFLCIPLLDYHLQRKISSFHSELDKFKDAKGYDPSILVSPHRMHLTVVMLKLYTDEAKQKAIQLLKKAAPTVYDMCDTRTMSVKLQGLDSMNGITT